MSHKTAKRQRANLKRLKSLIDSKFKSESEAEHRESAFKLLSRNLSRMSPENQKAALDELEKVSR